MLESQGKYAFTQLFMNAGYVLLRIDDRGYTVEYYTGGKRQSYTMRSPAAN